MTRTPLQGRRPAALLVIACMVTTACGSTAQTTRSGPAAQDVVLDGSASAPQGGSAGGINDGLSLDQSEPTSGATVTGPGGAGAAPGASSAGGSQGSGTQGGSPAAGGGQPGTGQPAGGQSSGGQAGGGGPAVVPGQGPAPQGAVPVSGDTQGITPSEIKIGFIGLDQAGTAGVGDAFGAAVPNPGDSRSQVEAVVKYINERGGVAGRKIVPVVINRSPNSSDPNQMESICVAMTEDNGVFAVVTNFTDDTQACYAQRRTLLLDDSLASEREVLQPLDPFVWGPGLPTSEGGFRAFVDSLAGQGFFEPGMKLGVLVHDEPDLTSVYENVVAPGLAGAGHGVDVPIFIVPPESSTDNGSWAAAIKNAQLKFATEGVTHVLFVAPGAGVPLLFMNQAESQLYRPRYGLSSYDSPGLLLQPSVSPEQLRRAVGAGFNMIVDVDAANGDPYPTGVAEERCHEALQSTGQAPPPTRATAFAAEFICDGAFMLQAAAQGLDANLSIQSWAAQAERLGLSFQATYSLPGGTRFDPGIRAGGQFYRHLRFVDECNCFRYASDNLPVPR